MQCECAKSELDLFAGLSAQTNIIGNKSVLYKHVASISDSVPIESVVPGHGDDYIDLPHTMLHIRGNITKTDRSDLTSADKKIGPVNDFLSAMFSEVQIYLNNQPISYSSHTYPYRSYIGKLLNYNANAKTTHLQTTMRFKDTAGHMDSVADSSNSGFKQPSLLTGLRRPFELLDYIHGDIFNQEKFLLSGVQLRIKLIPAKPVFCLMGETGAEGKVVITDATLLVKKIDVSPTVKIAQNKLLQNPKFRVKYPITKVQVKSETLPQGIMDTTLLDLLSGIVTKRIIEFVTNTAFNDTYTTNPFNKHISMSFFTLYVDGTPVPSKPLQPDFHKLYIRAYSTLFTGFGVFYSNQGNDFCLPSIIMVILY